MHQLVYLIIQIFNFCTFYCKENQTDKIKPSQIFIQSQLKTIIIDLLNNFIPIYLNVTIIHLTLLKMDRDISSGNRVIANYMQEKQKKRLQERIKYIKSNKSIYSSNGFIRQKPRVNSVFFERSMQIERQNAYIFNRIASIIKKQPKVNVETASSAASLKKSRQTSFLWHRKIQSSLQEQNKLIQKRLTTQKPTINNKLFYQQRAKNLKILKNVSKYPYILGKRTMTEPDQNAFDQVDLINPNNQPETKNSCGPQDQKEYQQSLPKLSAHKEQTFVKELFSHQSLDFTILVSWDLRNDVCTFLIQSKIEPDEKYTLNIPKQQFVEYFQESDHDYEKMIGNLRLNDSGNITYVNENNSHKNKSPRENVQLFKFKAQSTAYTSTGFKSGTRFNKRNLLSKHQNQQMIRNSKTDRKMDNSKAKDRLKELKNKQQDNMTEAQFSQIKLTEKE